MTWERNCFRGLKSVTHNPFAASARVSENVIFRFVYGHFAFSVKNHEINLSYFVPQAVLRL